MGHFSFFMEIGGKKGVILGGGRVAARKVEKLLPFGPVLTCIAPAIEDVYKRQAVVVGEFSLFPYPVTQIGIINNMIGANQAGQVEGFGRGINRDGPVSGIF